MCPCIHASPHRRPQRVAHSTRPFGHFRRRPKRILRLFSLWPTTAKLGQTNPEWNTPADARAVACARVGQVGRIRGSNKCTRVRTLNTIHSARRTARGARSPESGVRSTKRGTSARHMRTALERWRTENERRGRIKVAASSTNRSIAPDAHAMALVGIAVRASSTN